MGFNSISTLLNGPESMNIGGQGLEKMVPLLGNSIVLGLLVFFLSYKLSLLSSRHKKISAKNRAKLLLGNSNIFYLCVGLTAIMILVNNNLARAFSIGAAIALIRFRVKVGRKNDISSILFGIVIGIACGLNDIILAWGIFLIYAVFAVFFTMLVCLTDKSVLEEDVT